MAPAAERADIAAMARNSPALRVHGPSIVRWVRHLARVLDSRPELYASLGITMDEGRLEVLEQLNGVPEAILGACMHAVDEEQANLLQRTFNQGREGYAQTRCGREEDPGE